MYPVIFNPRARRWTDRQIEASGEQLHVLVVDDDGDAAEALAAYLALEEIACQVAVGGADANARGNRWRPHVILMDISMPECNGFQAACALRQYPQTRGIAIIAHTALNETEVRRHLAEAEFDGYFQKGQPVERLVRLMMDFVR